MYQLAQPNQIEKQNGLQESRDHFRNNMSSRTGTHANTPSPPTASTAPAARARRSAKGVVFTPSLQVHRYPPAVWGEEEEDDEDDVEALEDSLQRLRDADEATRRMTREEYVHYSECRQASFTFRKSGCGASSSATACS